MRIFVAIILSILFFIPTIGTITYFSTLKSIIKSNVKAEIEAGLDEDDLITFIFSKEEVQNLEWEHDKEFSYGGKMYDVVNKKEVDNNLFEIVCYEDNKETALQKLISSRIANQFDQHPSKESNEKYLINFLQNLIVVESEQINALCLEYSINEFLHQDALNLIYSNQFHPPPQEFIS